MLHLTELTVHPGRADSSWCGLRCVSALLEDDAATNAHRPIQLEVELCGMIALRVGRLALLVLRLVWWELCAALFVSREVALLIDVTDTLRASLLDIVLTREVSGDDHLTDVLF